MATSGCSYQLRVEQEHPNLTTFQFDATKIERIRCHIFDVLCAGRQEAFDYLMSWLRAVVVDKAQTGIALVFDGAQGTGKGVFFDKFLGNQVIGWVPGIGRGSHYGQLTRIEHATGRFNGLTEDKLLIILDHVLIHPNSLPKLTALITEPTYSIRHKWNKPVTFPNYTNLIFTTNNPRPVGQAAAATGRFVVFTPSHKHVRDHAYFKELMEEMVMPGAVAHFYKMLEMAHGFQRVDLGAIPTSNI